MNTYNLRKTFRHDDISPELVNYSSLMKLIAKTSRIIRNMIEAFSGNE